MTKKLYLTYMELRTFYIDQWIIRGLFKPHPYQFNMNSDYISRMESFYIDTIYRDNKFYTCLYKDKEFLPPNRYHIINQRK